MVDGPGLYGLRTLVWAMRKVHLEVSFSQEGEDRILDRFFEDQQRGFYVDIGALHPVRFSNTLLLYLKGWRGVNVDATPGSMRLFRSLRRRDINLEVAVGKDPATANFFIFREAALNTFDVELAQQRLEEGWELHRVVPVRQQPLSMVWDEAVPRSVAVDLLTIDVEGMDVEVLQTLDWSRQRPRVVCVEQLRDGNGQSVEGLLADRGYHLLGRTVNTVLYAEGGTAR